MSALKLNKNMLDLIEGGDRPSFFNYQYAKWLAMWNSINADMELEIIRTNELKRNNPSDENAQKHSVYLEQTFKNLHSEVVLVEDIFSEQISNDDLANFYMLSNVVMGHVSRSFAPKNLSDETAGGESVDWEAYLRDNQIPNDPTDTKWVALGQGMLRKLFDELKLAFVRMELLCTNIVFVDDFMTTNADDLQGHGDRIFELIDWLALSDRRDCTNDKLSSKDLEHKMSQALSIGMNRCNNSPDDMLVNYFRSPVDNIDLNFGSSHIDDSKSRSHQQEIELRTMKTLKEYDELKKQYQSVDVLRQQLEQRLREVKLAERMNPKPFEDRRVETFALLQKLHSFQNNQ